MAGLDKILKLFAREGVTEIILQSDRVVAIRRDNKVEAASRAPLSSGQIAALLQSEPALAQIPAPGSPPTRIPLNRPGLRLSVVVQCGQQQIQVRLVREGEADSPTPPTRHGENQAAQSRPAAAAPTPTRRPPAPASSATPTPARASAPRPAPQRKPAATTGASQARVARTRTLPRARPVGRGE